MADNAPETSPVECKNVWQKWTGFLDKELTPEESARVQKHLDECSHCREFVDTQSQFNRLLRKSLIDEAQEMPEVLRVKVLSLLERKGYGQLTEEEEAASKESVLDAGKDRPSKSPGQAGHDHGHEHGTPGHVHDHEHGHSHSHGPSPATRAALAVMGVGLVLLFFMFFVQRGKNDSLSEKLAATEEKLEETRTAFKLSQDNLREMFEVVKGIKLAQDRLVKERDEEREKNKALQKKYDATVENYDKLSRAMTSIVNAGLAVQEGEKAMKPVPELEKKWRDMFPKIGDMPHRAGDMDPSLWDVTPIEGEDVLWVVFSKKGDPKSKFTLMTFTEKYMKEHFGELNGMAETVKDGKATITWQNSKDQKVYHALVSAGDLDTARRQREALK